jgi:hypothetical protein
MWTRRGSSLISQSRYTIALALFGLCLSPLISRPGVAVVPVSMHVERAPTRISLIEVRTAPSILRQSAGRRWGEFETEYGVHQPSASPFKRSLQRAKYQIDETTFTLNGLIKSLEARSEIQLGNGRKHAMLSDVRLKGELNLTTGKPYLGFRVTIPFGS